MRQWAVVVTFAAAVAALAWGRSPSGHGRAGDAILAPFGTPVGWPVGSPVAADPAAATVAALGATVAAQQRELVALTVRVDELEAGVATLLSALPEQASLDAFQQDRIDDLAARVADLEAARTTAAATPAVAGSPIAPPTP